MMLKHIAEREVSYDQFFDLFQEVEFFDVNQSYCAIEFVFKFIQGRPGVEKIICGQRDFLYRADQNVGVLMNFVMNRNSGPHSLVFDVHKRVTCFSTTRSSISAFFSKYPSAILAVDAPKEEHDSVLFMKKFGRGFEYIHFNPNFDERVPIAEYIIKRMSRDSKVQRYNAEDGDDPWNVSASCSAHVWQQVYRFMCLKFNPFDREVLFPWNKRYRKFMYPNDLLMEEEIEIRRRALMRYPNRREPENNVCPSEKKKRIRGI